MNDDERSKEKIHSFLQSHASAVLSTITPDNNPSAAAIYVVADDKLNLYFLTKSDTAKSKNIKSNKKAALAMTDPSTPITLQVTGTIEEVKDPDSFLHMFIKIAEENAQQHAGFSWPPPLSKIRGAGGLLMYKLKPTWLRLGDFSQSGDVIELKEGNFHELKLHEE